MPALDLAARIEAFVNAATTKHAGKYDYSRVPDGFVNAHTKVIIGCPDHGDFLQTPNEHRRGQRCRDCAARRGSSADARRRQFIDQARDLHGHRFGYSTVEYVNRQTPVIITCRRHGPFSQRPDHHTNPAAPSICQTCADEERSQHLKKAWKRRDQTARGEEGRFTTG